MFDRFIRLARAKKALREQRFLDALQQASDTLIEGDRRAENIRVSATRQLVERGRARLEAGDLEAARAVARSLLSLCDSDPVVEFSAAVDAASAAREVHCDARTTLQREFKRLLDAGELRSAEALLAGPDAGVDRGDLAELGEQLAERRREAEELVHGVLHELSNGAVGSALDAYRRAVRLDRELSTKLRARAQDQLVRTVVRELDQGIRDGALSAAMSTLGRVQANAPELLEHDRMGAAVECLSAAFCESLRTADSLVGAGQLARALRSSSLAVDEAADRLVAALLACQRGQGGGSDTGGGSLDDAVAFGELQAAAHAFGASELARQAADLLAGIAQGEQRLEAGRQLLESGQLEAARAMFVDFLSDNPMHEGVQRELELVDEGLADLDRRLADVRLALRAGRLREACRGAMALIGSTRIAAEAQQILSEARSRISLVNRGLDEIRVALHGRAAASREGVRHCLKRLEELAKVQSDHESLPGVVAAVTVELDALGLCEKAAAGLARSDLEPMLEAVPQLVAVRSSLLDAERIDAKLCQLGDEVVDFGEQAMRDGRLADMQRGLELLEQLEPVRGDFVERAAQWRRAAEERRAHVATLLAQAREQLDGRNLAEAERLVDAARQEWQESAEARAMTETLRRVRRQADTLEQVATMTEEKDFLGAQQKLASMPAVPAMLRTRVYDMKQDLAKAQGLEGAFLLRVDEGGEILVARGETVTIGNVRQARADLPLLANLAGRHASIRRSMSFHGGMQDTVVAEDGDVRVAGERVEKAVLNSGQRVELGPALALLYQRPTKRSLTSRLILQGGFQIAGTDRILLMKDRGRDGRILLGPGRDVHVQVPKATGEVEVFANNSGQVRVACAQGGLIDGKAFRGEHPIAAGQIVEAGGISFLLMPWRPGS